MIDKGNLLEKTVDQNICQTTKDIKTPASNADWHGPNHGGQAQPDQIYKKYWISKKTFKPLSIAD